MAAGSGTAAAEMAMINTIPANGNVLYLSNGKFAERWVKIGERNKWNATVLKAEYGTAVPVQQVADALKQKSYDAVVLVHSETSACTVTDLAGIAALTQVDVSKYQHPVALICGGNAAAEPVWAYYESVGRQKGTIPATERM